MRLLRLRERSASLARLHGRLIGLCLGAKAIEGVVLGRGVVFAGEAFAPDGHVPAPGLAAYVAVVAVQLSAAVALAAARAPRWLLVAAALATSLDTLVATQNNRLFLTVMVWLVALGPRPDPERRSYWHLDAAAWQLAIVYVSAAVHKITPNYLSGATLRHLSEMPHAILGFTAPLENPHVATVAAYLVVGTELGLPALLFGGPKRARVGIALAAGMHLTMAVVLPDAWTFSLVAIVSLLPFVPERRVVPRTSLGEREGAR